MPDGTFFHFEERKDDSAMSFPTHPSVNSRINVALGFLPQDSMLLSGCIRINDGTYIKADSYISLPNEEITDAQYKSLTRWLDQALIGIRLRRVSVGVRLDKELLEISNMETDDIIKDIERYYRTTRN